MRRKKKKKPKGMTTRGVQQPKPKQARIARNRAAALQRRVASQRQWPDPTAHGTTVRRKRRTTPDHTPADRELAEAAALAEEEEAMAAAAAAASQAHAESARAKEEEAMAAAAAAAPQAHVEGALAKEKEAAVAAAEEAKLPSQDDTAREADAAWRATVACRSNQKLRDDNESKTERE